MELATKTLTCESDTTELSSLIASSTMSRLGLDFWRRIAVLKSGVLKSKNKKTLELDLHVKWLKRCVSTTSKVELLLIYRHGLQI